MVMVLTPEGPKPLFGMPAGYAPMSRFSVGYPYTPMELALLKARPWLAGTPYVRMGPNPRLTGSRAGAVMRRLLRYAALAGGMFAAGYFAGYYLTAFKAAALSGAVALAGGAHVTKMVAADLEAIGFESRFLRRALAGTVGSYAAWLPFLGGLTGLLVWAGKEYGTPFQIYMRRRITGAGRRGLTGR